jgi:hypothetical protein
MFLDSIREERGSVLNGGKHHRSSIDFALLQTLLQHDNEPLGFAKYWAILE